MTNEELHQAFEEAQQTGNFDDAYAIEQQLKAQADPRGVGAELVRQAGLTGRAIAGGAAQMAQPFTAPVRYLMNKALPGNPIGNLESATDELLTKAGVPEPENATERGVQSVGRFATGFAAGFGGANKVDDAVSGLFGLANKAKPITPSTEGIKETATRMYKEADESGLIIKNQSFDNFVNGLDEITTKAGIDSGIHPKATSALKRLKAAAETGDEIKLQDFDILRRVANGARASLDDDEARIGSIIVDSMDDYMGRMGKADVTAGNPQKAKETLDAARLAWSRKSKSEIIEEAVEKAGIRAGQFSGSGYENALRTQFRQIAMSNKRMRGFSPEERQAVKLVASGGAIDNAFRGLGKLAPTGGMSMIMSPAAGYGVGGEFGMLALPTVGAISRKIATNRTDNNVAALSDLVRGGDGAKDAPDWLLPWLSGSMFGADTEGN